MLRRPVDLVGLAARKPFVHVDANAYYFEASFLRAAPVGDLPMERLESYGCIVSHLDIGVGTGVVCAASPRGGKLIGDVTGVLEKEWRVVATGRTWNVVEAVAMKAAALATSNRATCLVG
jgi:hypothetical protein